MKFENPLDDIFSAPSNVKVLRVLSLVDWELTGRQIADRSGLNAMTCQNTLNRLNDLGILAVRRVGSANLYRLIRDKHLVQRLVLPLFAGERDLLKDALDPTIEVFSEIASAIYLFGSTASGAANYGSDLDICVLVRNKSLKEPAEEISDRETTRLSRLTGAVPTILVWTEREFKTRLNRRDTLARSIIEGRSLFRKQ